MSNRMRRVLAIGVAAGLAGAVVATDGAAAAPVIHHGPTDTVLGRTIASWSPSFITWALEKSALDPKKFQITECQKGQHGKVFFVPTAFGGNRRLTCTVPAGMPLFASPAGYVTVDDVADGLDLVHRDAVTQVGFKLNGTPVRFVKRDWVRKSGFSLRFPGEKRGRGTFAGYGVMVTDLEPGVHRIVQFTRVNNADGSVFTARMTITLTVTA